MESAQGSASQPLLLIWLRGDNRNNHPSVSIRREVTWIAGLPVKKHQVLELSRVDSPDRQLRDLGGPIVAPYFILLDKPYKLQRLVQILRSTIFSSFFVELSTGYMQESHLIFRSNGRRGKVIRDGLNSTERREIRTAPLENYILDPIVNINYLIVCWIL